MTNISTAVIIVISASDITAAEITATDRKNLRKGGHYMGMSSDNIALTEAVYYILLSLHKPLHGYGIMQNTEELSGGRVKLAAGTLYGALNTLLEKGWIKAVSGGVDSRKKEYEITESGRLITLNELERLKELVRNGELTLGGGFR